MRLRKPVLSTADGGAGPRAGATDTGTLARDRAPR